MDIKKNRIPFFAKNTLRDNFLLFMNSIRMNGNWSCLDTFLLTDKVLNFFFFWKVKWCFGMLSVFTFWTRNIFSSDSICIVSIAPLKIHNSSQEWRKFPNFIKINSSYQHESEFVRPKYRNVIIMKSFITVLHRKVSFKCPWIYGFFTHIK